MVHTIIADNNIHLLALQETWIDVDDPSAIQADLAPTGYGVLHVHRPSSKESHRGRDAKASRLNRGGGLAIVYRQELYAKAHRLQPVTKPSTFEYQLAVLKTNTSTSLIINIYRPPSPWIASQPSFDELADLISVLLTSSSQAVVVCGDLNCHGDDPYCTDKRLAAVFDLLNMKQYVHSTTRDDRLVDILACSDDELIHDVIVDDAGNVSDHRLIESFFRVSKRWTPVKYQFRPLSKMDFDFFEQSLLSSSLFTDPENTADAFVDQLRIVVTSILDKLAPLRTVTRISGSSHVNRFTITKGDPCQEISKKTRTQLEGDRCRG